jgi:3-dehydroquinate dehydratase II
MDRLRIGFDAPPSRSCSSAFQLQFVIELRRTLDNFRHRPQTSFMSKPKRALGLRSRTPRRILIIHGPNLDMLGTREPGIYGSESLASINARLGRMAKREGAALETFQSNHEGALIERVHGAKKQRISWIIVNPGGADSYQRGVTRRFGSGRDPFPRGALSNIYSREPFRRHSYFSDLAAGTICGLGSRGYDFALQFALHPN